MSTLIPDSKAIPNRRALFAFTLVELLITIGIIAILIATTLTIVTKVKKAAYGASTGAQLSSLSNAIQQYYGDYKAYPGPLANNQLGSAYAPNSSQFVASIGAASLVAAPAAKNTMGINLTNNALLHITGSQNMVLGLLGGLEYQTVPTVAFYYAPNDIFPDGINPGPVGAASLNPNNPRRQQSYIQVRAGDISVPMMSYNNSLGASFADLATRSPSDAPIPVFLDKYPNPLPILYIRTNPGGQAIAGIRSTSDGSTALYDPTAQQLGYTVNPVPQYDLCQILDYTRPNMNNPSAPSGGFSGGFIGVNYSNKAASYHGLQGLGSQTLGSKDPRAGLVDTINSAYVSTLTPGQNGVAYLRDPSFKVDMDSSGNITSYDPVADNCHAGVPREKDGFILITAGPDRAYGTTDDIIFPGSLIPPQ